MKAAALPDKPSRAERQKRYRERQKTLEMVVPAEVDVDLVEDLVAGRWLPRDRDDDREAIGAALVTFARENISTVTRNALKFPNGLPKVFNSEKPE